MSLRHTIWPLCLACLVLVNVLSMPLVRLGYELNKDYIIQNLCVNRARPQLHCDGKCHLTKTLKAASQESKNQTDFKVKPISFEFLGTAPALVATAYTAPTAACYGTYTARAYNAYSSKIPHPPQG